MSLSSSWEDHTKKNWIHQPYPQYSLKQIHLMKQYLDTRLQESLCMCEHVETLKMTPWIKKDDLELMQIKTQQMAPREHESHCM